MVIGRGVTHVPAEIHLTFRLPVFARSPTPTPSSSVISIKCGGCGEGSCWKTLASLTKTLSSCDDEERSETRGKKTEQLSAGRFGEKKKNWQEQMRRGVAVMHVAFVGCRISRRSEVHYRLQSTKSPERLSGWGEVVLVDHSQVVPLLYLLFMRRFFFCPLIYSHSVISFLWKNSSRRPTFPGQMADECPHD